MASEWRAVQLGEIARFKAGSAFKPEHQGQSSGELPFIKVSDLNLPGNEHSIRTANNWVSRDLARQIKAAIHPEGATVFAKIGVALTYNRRRLLRQDTLIDNNMMSAAPDSDTVRSRYLYFLLKSLDFNEVAHGSALPYLNVSDLKSIVVGLPDLQTQDVILELMAAIEDRIDCLSDTNAILEATAQTLFKSWFVDFDPVRAKAEGREPEGMDATTAALFPSEFEDSELGPIPKGWRTTRVGDVVDIVKGRSYKSSELQDSDTALVTLKSFNRGGGFRRDGFKPYVGPYKAEQVLKEGDCIVAFTDVTQQAELIGRSAIVTGSKNYGRLIASLDVGILRPRVKSLTPAFLRALMSEDRYVSHIKGFVTGTTVLHLAKEGLPNYRFAMPPAEVIDRWSVIGEACSHRQALNVRKVDSLNELRDTLLPRLISGKLRLPEEVGQALAEA